MKRGLLSVFTIVILIIFSCEQEKFITSSDAQISFSVDTLYFDTVFTSLGTATKSFTIHNPHKEFISISELRLAKAENSVFRINVDGVPGTLFHDIDIAPGDSLYVFVDATLDPNESDEILLQQDSVVTITNGKVQDLDIVAWGQDVHLLRAVDSLGTQTWINDKPYLIIDYVLVDSNAVLTLDPGVRVYLHRDAIFAVQGSLIANGSLEEPISFQGDRLEALYKDIPGQWGGMYFIAGSRDNELNYVNLKGSNFGMIVDTFMNENPSLKISNSTLKHISSVGILGRGAKIDADNCLIANCGSSALALTIGGNYNFNHCTIANSWEWSPVRTDPSLYITNYYIYKDGNGVNQVEIRDIENAYFGNCIIWGTHNNELIIDKYPEGGILNYHFENCLGRFDPMEVEINDDNFPGLINEDPTFISWDEFDFQLDTLSPAKDAGRIDIGLLFPIDINGTSRTSDSAPDIGAFERIEK
ncbi:MAG: hypothetical protein K9H49_15200 [Bacteroidales bacterium]|nr:hypothetical protein [Bacteroidales bacterium]MCF8391585.1 hypothetical protein [Bacteroidales bacterium]